LFETRKEMMKESELQTAKTPYDKKEQTKDPCIPTIKVNFSKVAVVQGLLEFEKMKMEIQWIHTNFVQINKQN